MITSADNPKVRAAKELLDRKGRERQGRCLAEGSRLIEDAMRAGVTPALILFTSEAAAAERVQSLLRHALDLRAPAYEVSAAILGTLSDTVTSQGIIAALPIDATTARATARLVLVLDAVRDPGNVGTILRSAVAAGDVAVVVAPGTADPWSPKALRAGMGAHFRLAIESAGWDVIPDRLAGRHVWVADASGATPYDRVDWSTPSALIIGGEAQGPGAEARGHGWPAAAIPMAAGAESLNAAMATTAFLFEAARQWRAHGAHR